MDGMSGGEKEKSNDALLILLELLVYTYLYICIFVYHRKFNHSIEINR